MGTIDPAARLRRSLLALLSVGAASNLPDPARAGNDANTDLYPIVDHTLRYRTCSSPTGTLKSDGSWCAEMVSSGAENIFRLIIRNGLEDDACILDTGNRIPDKNPDKEYLRDSFKEKADDSGTRTYLGLDSTMHLFALRYFTEGKVPAKDLSGIVDDILKLTTRCSLPALTS